MKKTCDECRFGVPILGMQVCSLLRKGPKRVKRGTDTCKRFAAVLPALAVLRKRSADAADKYRAEKALREARAAAAQASVVSDHGKRARAGAGIPKSRSGKVVAGATAHR